jgi:hypothetical protein
LSVRRLTNLSTDMTWYVQLSGDPHDISALSHSINGPDIAVVRDGADYFLTISDMPPDADARSVVDRGGRIVEVMNGAARLALDARQPLRIGSVHRRNANGGRDIFVFPEPAVIHVRAFAPTVTVTRADGSVEVARPADPVADWTRLAASDEAVANALRLIGNGELDWVNLYRVFEIVCADAGGIGKITSNGWSTKQSIALFKHTANSPGALGLDARHGAESTAPPSKPMPISEARALVRAIVHAWLRSKT